MKTNQRAENCWTCGKTCEPGEGRLEFVPDAEDNDDFDRLADPNAHPEAHWEVYCLDRMACESRQQETAERHAAEAAKAKAERAVEAAELKARREADLARWREVTAGLERTEARPEGITLADSTSGWVVSWIGDWPRKG